MALRLLIYFEIPQPFDYEHKEDQQEYHHVDKNERPYALCARHLFTEYSAFGVDSLHAGSSDSYSDLTDTNPRECLFSHCRNESGFVMSSRVNQAARGSPGSLKSLTMRVAHS